MNEEHALSCIAEAGDSTVSTMVFKHRASVKNEVQRRGSSRKGGFSYHHHPFNQPFLQPGHGLQMRILLRSRRRSQVPVTPLGKGRDLLEVDIEAKAISTNKYPAPSGAAEIGPLAADGHIVVYSQVP